MFDEEWIGLSLFALFKIEDDVIGPILITNNECSVPTEAIKKSGMFEIGVYGSDSTVDKRISTNWCKIIIVPGAYTAQTSTPAVPESDVWEQYLTAVSLSLKNAAPKIGDNNNWFVWDAEEGKYTDSSLPSRGEKGEKGDTGENGADGATPVRGTDYWTESDKNAILSELENTLNEKQDILTFDTQPVANSDNPVTSGGINTALQSKISFENGKGLATLSQGKTSHGTYENGSRIYDYSLSVYEYRRANTFATKSASFYPVAAVDHFISGKADMLKSVPHKTVTDYPVTVSDHLENEPLISCKVYGSSSGVGTLVESGDNVGKYQITVRIFGKNFWNMSALPSSAGIEFNSDDSITCQSNIISSAALSEICPDLSSGDIIVPTVSGTVSTFSLYEYDSSSSQWLCNDSFGMVVTDNQPINVTSAMLAMRPGFSSGTYFIQFESGIFKSAYEQYVQPTEQSVFLTDMLTTGQNTTISGLCTIGSSQNTLKCVSGNTPSKIEISYYRDINKVLAALENNAS